MILIGEVVNTPDGPGRIHNVEESMGDVVIILDKNSHRNNPPVYWATIKEVEEWKNDEV